MTYDPTLSVNILGVRVDGCSIDHIIPRLEIRITTDRRRTLMYANVHVLNIAYEDPELRGILNRADLVCCDGAGVRLGARLLGRQLPERMTGADWIDPLCSWAAQHGTRLFFLAGRPGATARAAELLQDRHPGLNVAGVHHGYLAEPSICAAAIGRINAARPHILLVGMGTPIQERWIDEHRSELETPVVWSVGALFDFVSGTQPRGPRWMLDHGLEWLFRLSVEPTRMWRRYLVGNPLFLWRVLKQRMGRPNPEE